MKTALTIIFIIVCIAIILLVLCQEAKDNGLGSLAGGSSAETYWSKNGRSKEGTLALITGIAVVIFMVLAIVIGSKFLN